MSDKNISISQTTQQYIRLRPALRECLLINVINYSALARKIAIEHNIKKIPAVLAAIQRYFNKHKNTSDSSRNVLHLLKQSQINIRSKVATMTIYKPYNRSSLTKILEAHQYWGNLTNVIESNRFSTLITDENFIDLLRQEFKSATAKVTKRLSQVTLTFPKQIETTPGVVAYVCSLLSLHNINIRDLVSCADEVVITVNKDDVQLLLSILSTDN